MSQPPTSAITNVVRLPHRIMVAEGPRPWAHNQPLRVVHVGQSAVLLEREGARSAPELVAVTAASRGLVPGGCCLPDVRDFAGFRTAVLRRPTVDLSGWASLAARQVVTVDLGIHPRPLDPAAVALLVRLVGQNPPDGVGRDARRDGLHPLMDPDPLRRLAGPLTRAALASDAGEVQLLLRQLIGAGPGATPAGDDVVIGAVAALDAATGTALPRARAHVARAHLCAFLPSLLSATTRASRQDLVAAVEGQFAQHVHVLAEALTDPAAVPPALRAARGWGATSGIDVASGVAGAAAAVLTQHRADRRSA